MKNHDSTGTRFSRSCFVGVLTACMLAVSAIGSTDASAQADSVTSQTVTQAQREATYAQVWTTVRDSYAGKLPADFNQWKNRFQGKLATDKDLVVAVGDLLKVVDAPGKNAYQLNSEDVDTWIAAKNGSTKMIGMQFNMRSVFTSDTMPVTKIFDPSITEIAVGDEIVAIEGVKVKGARNDEFYKVLQGTAGSAVKMTVKRGAETREVSVKRSGSGNLEIEFKPSSADVVCVVEAIVPNSPAQAAGLQKGDVVKKIGAKAIDSDASQHDVLASVRSVPLGRSTELVIERNGATMVLQVTPGLVPKKDLFVSADLKPSDLFIQWTLGFWRLDSANIPGYLDDEFIDKVQKLDGGVIDLRSGTDSNPDIVAGIIARFTPTQGTIMSYTSKVNGKDVLTSYVVNGDELAKVVDGVQSPVGKIGKRYTGKLAATIDPQSTGASAYIAGALQRAGIKIVGIPTTSGRMYTTFGFDNGVVIKLYTGNLVNPDGTAFSGVTPNVLVTDKNFALPSDAADILSGL